jgi:serine/threonine protein kinase
MQPKNPDNLAVPEASTDRLNSLVGTEEYIAPETIQGTGVSYACDLWSLGVMLF